jgi:hypothetical protein
MWNYYLELVVGIFAVMDLIYGGDYINNHYCKFFNLTF